MDPLTGAAVASAVAWASILAARRVPVERVLGENGLSILAAASLAVVGLVLLGVPVPPAVAWGGLAALAIGLAAARALAAKTAKANARGFRPHADGARARARGRSRFGLRR